MPAGGCSLRGAFAAAQDGDTVQLAAGVYTLTFGQLTAGHSITVVGAGRAATTIRQTAQARVIRADASPFTLSGLTVTGGHLVAADGSAGAVFGAAGGPGHRLWGQRSPRLGR